MAQTHAIGFVTAALLAAGAATAVGLTGALSGPGLGAGPFGLGAVAAAPDGATTSPLPVLEGAKPWLTAVPGGPQSLRGKVVVVNFWTYSCINSLRALPYLRSWSERYASKGLVVVGVHTPEFQFEHDAARVRLASTQLSVAYPNLQDNDYSVWRSFANEGWPGFYFIDAQGRMRGYRIGEGQYAESEQFLRGLLAEAGQNLSGIPVVPVSGSGIEAEADWADLGSPETYLGYGKASGFASPEAVSRNSSRGYTAAYPLPLNRWDLKGEWTVGREFATLDSDGGVIRFRFHARDAHLVMGGADDGKPIRYRVTLDGNAPGENHGVDVDADGWGEIREGRLYQLVRQSADIADRTISIEFSRSGARAYVFTFG